MELSRVTDHGARVCVFLSKLQCQVGHGLSHTLHRHRLIVSEPVVLTKHVHGLVKHEQQAELLLISFQQCAHHFYTLTCVSTLALSIRVLASAINPLMAQPLRIKEQKLGHCLYLTCCSLKQHMREMCSHTIQPELTLGDMNIPKLRPALPF